MPVTDHDHEILTSPLMRFLLRQSPGLPKGLPGIEILGPVLNSLLDWLDLRHDQYDAFEVLGSGSYARVFWCKADRTKALKITTDQSDANACAILMRKPDPALLKVHNIIEIPKSPFFKAMYAILVEKLTPLSNAERRLWENAWEALPKLGVNLRHVGLQEDSLDDLKRYMVDAKPALVQIAQSVLPTLELWQEKLFQERQILWRDFHEGNILMRGRIPIISDYGLSLVKGVPSIPSLYYSLYY